MSKTQEKLPYKITIFETWANWFIYSHTQLYKMKNNINVDSPIDYRDRNSWSPQLLGTHLAKTVRNRSWNHVNLCKCSKNQCLKNRTFLTFWIFILTWFQCSLINDFFLFWPSVIGRLFVLIYLSLSSWQLNENQKNLLNEAALHFRRRIGGKFKRRWLVIFAFIKIHVRRTYALKKYTRVFWH